MTTELAIDDCLTCDGYVVEHAQWPLCPSCSREQHQMQIVCAWCGQIMRNGTEPASHSMCQTCSERMMAEMEMRR